MSAGGKGNRGIVSVTVWEAVSITERLRPLMPVFALVTYAVSPFGLNATPNGPGPTAMVEITVLVSVSITAT